MGYSTGGPPPTRPTHILNTNLQKRVQAQGETGTHFLTENFELKNTLGEAGGLR
jgi:hypothetical protein